MNEKKLELLSTAYSTLTKASLLPDIAMLALSYYEPEEYILDRAKANVHIAYKK